MSHWQTVLGVFPARVDFDVALPNGVAGEASLWRARIGSGYSTDDGLLRHELCHVTQFYVLGLLLGLINGLLAWCLGPLVHWNLPVALQYMPMGVALGLGLFAHPLLYQFVRVYRAVAEAQAYRAQMTAPDRNGGRLSIEDAALRMMSPRYDLGITIEEARRRVA